MSFEQTLTQEQRMQQRLSPQQLLYGRLLEMTAPQIEDEVRRELDENPALEVASTADDNHAAEDGFNETSEQLQDADYADEDDMPHYRSEARNRGWSDREYERQMADTSHSAYDDLTEQLRDFSLSDSELRVARYIVGNLDDSGYLRRSLGDLADDLAFNVGLDVDAATMERMFALVRSLDPAGIGATDLRDCLLLQLGRLCLSKPDDASTAAARTIIADHFDLFSKKHFDTIASRMGLTREDMQLALNVIQHLNPKPGALLQGQESDAVYITPDFSVTTDDAGRVTVALLSRTPELAIERSFDINNIPAPVASAGNRRHDAYAFIKRRYDDASAFIGALKMRAETMMAVMQAIVKLQPEFFVTYNTADIRPMILRNVADLTGRDISVVSRTSAGKYVATEQGVFPLKMFFNERPRADVDSSSHEIIDAIRTMIEKEDKSHPMSDETITQTLKRCGYDIARRTVAKYRERAGIPVARLRRQF